MRNFSRVIIFALVLLPMVSCNSSSKTKQSEKWSVRMANTVMEQADSLVNYLGAKESKKWQYDVALLGGAIDKLGYIDPKYSDYLKTYVDYFIREDGSIYRYNLEEYNIDRINPGKNLFTLYKRTGEEKYNIAIKQLASQMETHPMTPSGSYWHKKVYPNQIWLDGIYMASPFLAQYAKEYNEPKWFDIVGHQIINAYDKTVDSETGLLFHACDESREQLWSDPETGHSPNFWSRSMGWYVMAIVDVLDFLPEDHKDRDSIITILNNTLDALLKVTDPETGLWCQVPDQCEREGNYVEASGSIMYIYAMAKGAKKGYLDSKYMDIANEKFDSFVKNLITVEENGQLTLRNTCGGCGLGGTTNYRDGSYEYYITEKVVVNDTKGVGPFILTAIELDK